MTLYSLSQYTCSHTCLPPESLHSSLTDEILNIKEPQVQLISRKITEKALTYISSERALNTKVLHKKISECVHVFLSNLSLFLTCRMCLMFERGIPEKIRYVPFKESYTLFKGEENLSHLVTFAVMKKKSSELSQVIFCITEEERGVELSRECFTLRDLHAKL